MSDLNDAMKNVWEKVLVNEMTSNSIAWNAGSTTTTTNNGYGTITIGSQTLAGLSASTNLTPSTKVLGDDEHHDRLFWKYLVNVGWKKNIIDANGWAGAVQIVLLHDKCEKVLESRQLNGLSEEQAEIFGSTGYVTGLIATHKARGKCKALEEGEEEIEFVKLATHEIGTIQYSSAGGASVFDGTNWIAISGATP
jgi:hypothetical protein